MSKAPEPGPRAAVLHLEAKQRRHLAGQAQEKGSRCRGHCVGLQAPGLLQGAEVTWGHGFFYSSGEVHVRGLGLDLGVSERA